MRGKDFNTGLRGVLFEARHYERMGSAVWLYAWLVLRQTHQTGPVGWVLGGAPISYREIEEETGFNPRTLERWMRTLRRHGYIETESAMGGLIVRITKAKKHAHSARNFAKAGNAETLRRAAQGIRKLADGPRKVAEGDTHNCVADSPNTNEDRRFASRMGSSSVEEYLDKYTGADSQQEPIKFERALNSHPKNENSLGSHEQSKFQTLTPSCSGESQNQEPNSGAHSMCDPFAGPGRKPHVRVQPPRKPWIARDEVRLQLDLLRAEREEAVRRELYVGRGPEVRRPAPQDVLPPEAKRR